MEKVPFTPEGFETLQAMLYALTDTELAAEAAAVKSDFIAWAILHVELTTMQVAYLADLDVNFIAHLGYQSSFAFANRLPLNLILPPDYDPVVPPEDGKWIMDKSTIKFKNQPGALITATGNLIFEIVYPD